MRLGAADPSGAGLAELVPDGFHGVEFGADAGLDADVAHTDPADELSGEPGDGEPGDDEPGDDEPGDDEPAEDLANTELAEFTEPALSAGVEPLADGPAEADSADPPTDGGEPDGGEPAAEPDPGLGLITVVPELENPTRFSSRFIAAAASPAVVSGFADSAGALPPSEPLSDFGRLAPLPLLLPEPLPPEPPPPEPLPPELASAAGRSSAEPAASDPASSDPGLAIFTGRATGIVSEVALTLASEGGIAGLWPSPSVVVAKGADSTGVTVSSEPDRPVPLLPRSDGFAAGFLSLPGFDLLGFRTVASSLGAASPASSASCATGSAWLSTRPPESC